MIERFSKTPCLDRAICTTCAYRGKPERVTKGSTLIEVILWLCFLIPGLIYSIWRLGSKYNACPSCGSTTMIPESSPLGKKISQEHYPEEPPPPPPPPIKPSARAVNAGAALGRMVGKLVNKK